MSHNSSEYMIKAYTSTHIELGAPLRPSQLHPETPSKLAKAISLLPSDASELILSERRKLTFLILPDAALPFGMSTRSQGPKQDRRYTIVMYNEHQDLPEDLFIGSILRELAHVIAKRPPEEEWPTHKGDRARFKEHLESRADALVWKWGLRHYSIRHITATYPQHRANEIIESIGNALLENDLSWRD